MHFHCEIWAPSADEALTTVDDEMAPYDENEPANRNRPTFWDWYQVGGRWSGVHLDYDPAQDPRNQERCDYCGGTGFRRDEVGIKHFSEDPTYTCNGCGHYNRELKRWEHSIPGRVGWRAKWPTQWVVQNIDILPPADCRPDLECHTLIVKGQLYQIEAWVHEKTEFDGHVLPWLEHLKITDGVLVTVDFHD